MSRFLAIAGAVAVSATVSSASWDEPPGVYFAKDRGQAPSSFGTIPKNISRNNHIPIILAEARRQGVPDRLALKVCHIESRCNLYATGPKTKHGRHYGAYQIRPSSAARFGYKGGSLQGLPGLKYGMAHLADCLKRANGSESLAARCHVAGPGAIAGKRLAPWAERYAKTYTRQVMNAPAPAWAGTLVAMR